jgi:hypothetical protein
MEEKKLSVLERIRMRKENSIKKSEEGDKPSLQEQAEAVVAEVTAKTEEEPKEEAPMTETESGQKLAEALNAEEDTLAADIIDEPVEEKKEEPKKKRTRRTKAEMEAARAAEAKEKVEEDEDKVLDEVVKEEAPTKEETVDTSKPMDILGKKMKFDEVAAIVLDYFEDSNWHEIEESLSNKMNEIRIEPDMNPGTLKYVLADLNNLSDEVSVIHDQQDKLLRTLTEKDFGTAIAYQIVHSVGSNAEDRKRNGYLALTKAKVGDKTINYIALIAALRIRHTFTTNLMKRIHDKCQICITMSGAIKMEQTMVLGQ